MELYVALKVVWAFLLGVLLSGLGVMVGMDMGVGTLLRFVGRTDDERRAMLSAIEPHWDGNQVWFILGGGAIFAAFPTLYATSFSTFYVVMLLLLFSMIMRPLAFEYRSKVDARHWRETWDWAFLVSGAVPMFIFGAAFGNVMQGIAFHFTWDGQYYLDQSFIWYVLNPFAILCGLMSVALSLHQGSAMLLIRTEAPIAERAARIGSMGGWIAAVLFVIGGIWVWQMNSFAFIGPVDPGMAATPLGGPAVVRQVGAWLGNFETYPGLWAIPAVGLLSMIVGPLALRGGHGVIAWWLAALAWVATIFTVGVAMFPFLMPSTTAPSQSLTVWNSTGSAYNLTWMLVFAAIFVPAIIIYTGWAFRVMTGGSRTDDAVANDQRS